MENYIVCNPAGRVVAVRPIALWKREDAAAYGEAVRRVVPSFAGKAVICGDYRRVTVFPSEVTDELQRLYAELNPYILRSGILVTPNHSVPKVQVERVMRGAQHPQRRSLTSRVELETWLGEILTPEERGGVSSFLDEGDRPPSSTRFTRESELPGLESGRRNRRSGV
jgi:hypothetical protein